MLTLIVNLFRSQKPSIQLLNIAYKTYKEAISLFFLSQWVKREPIGCIMKKENESDYIIEQFTLQEEDFGEFAKLITSSFLSDGAAQEEGATIVFNEDTFRMMFGAPSVNRDLFVKATHKESNEIVGFLGAIPRELKIVDKNYKFGIPCWLCVHSKHQRKGIATALGEKLFSI